MFTFSEGELFVTTHLNKKVTSRKLGATAPPPSLPGPHDAHRSCENHRGTLLVLRRFGLMAVQTVHDS
jgi:hypothetical protein